MSCLVHAGRDENQLKNVFIHAWCMRDEIFCD